MDAEPELCAHALRALGGALQLSGEPERAAPWYQLSLELFIACGDEIQTANLRYRVAANMADGGETAAAWPLLEESLRTFRQLGLPRGDAQVLGYLSDKAYEDGDLALAAERSLESAAIARELGWAWWEAGQLRGAARFERELGSLMTRRFMHSGRSSSLWASAGGNWCSLPPSWRFSPQNGGTPSGQGGFGARSRAKSALDR